VSEKVLLVFSHCHSF